MKEPDILGTRLRRLIEQTGLGRVGRIEPLTGGLATRRFFRLTLTDGDPASVIARVEADEDPSIRPEGAAPEPDLEPTRTLLEQAGLPVPRCLGDTQGIYLQEVDVEGLEAALREHRDLLLVANRATLAPLEDRLLPRSKTLYETRLSRMDLAVYRVEAAR